MAGKRKEKNVMEDPRYHDTRRLLRKYRDVTWSDMLPLWETVKNKTVKHRGSIYVRKEKVKRRGENITHTKISGGRNQL